MLPERCLMQSEPVRQTDLNQLAINNCRGKANVNYLENQVSMEIPRVMVWRWVEPRLFPNFSNRVSVRDKRNHYLYVPPLLL